MKLLFFCVQTFSDKVFYWCVDVLKKYSAQWGMTYEELNVLVFCIIEPVVFLLMLFIIFKLRRRNKELKNIATDDLKSKNKTIGG